MSRDAGTVVVVPARAASTRLPRKLFLAESGRPLLAHTLERCLAATRPARVVAAVDDPELATIARAAGAEAVLTDPALPSGSDRVWAAVAELGDVERVVNVQGDEAEIEPEAIDAVCTALADGAAAVTLSAPLPAGALDDPAAVKVVCDLGGDALYFSRAPIPHARSAGEVEPRLHVGVYGYRRDILADFAARSPTPLERAEGLEQLRLLEHGVALQVLAWERAFLGIDTRRDYDAFLERFVLPRPDDIPMTRFIFVTGGVVSSLGKGLTTAAIAVLLEKRGLKVSIQKLDPYINVDPGTMSPFEHGEVYVTEDGAETDLDLGHYERYSQAPITKDSNATTGSIYSEVIRRERAGDYLGKTVQVIPHITDAIQDAIRRGAPKGTDVAIVEIGGTAGDIESLPFLEAIRQFALKQEPHHAMFVHLTLLPYLSASGEMKTKPTQQSVGKLREIGIQPDVLVCRCEQAMTEGMKAKISLFCNVREKDVIQEKDVDTTIYEVPLDLKREGLDRALVEHLDLRATEAADLSDWEDLCERVRRPEGTVEIAVVGKYIQLHDAYKSIYEALAHGGAHHRVKVRFRKVAAEDCADRDPAELLAGVDGLLVPGGFGERGLEGKIRALAWARENRMPTFGICFGMQAMALEFARNVAQLAGANSTEVDGDCAHPVIALMDEQQQVVDKGGTMRLGAYACRLAEGSRAAAVYGRDLVFERHRHRWEFNNAYRERLEDAGLVCSGVHESQDLVEVIELSDRPFHIGVQYHPRVQVQAARRPPAVRRVHRRRARLPRRRGRAAGGRPGRHGGAGMSGADAVPGGDFRLFLQKIAMQGFFALGLVEIPGAPKQEPNPTLARAVVDDLLMLREKSQGNLDDGERLTLDKYISDLQLHVVQAEGGGQE